MHQYITIGNKYEGHFDVQIEWDADGYFEVIDIPESIPYTPETVERMVIDQLELEAMQDLAYDPDYGDWADKYADEVLSFQESLWDKID